MGKRRELKRRLCIELKREELHDFMCIKIIWFSLAKSKPLSRSISNTNMCGLSKVEESMRCYQFLGKIGHDLFVC
jgi:hypothetical protein